MRISSPILVLAATLMALTSGCKKDDITGQVVDLDHFFQGTIQIDQNPHGIAPLTAVLTFTADIPCHSRITIPGDHPVEKVFPDLQLDHEIPILGLYPDSANQVTLTLTDADGNTATTTLEIITDPLPAGFPEVRIETANTSRMEPGFHLSGLHLANQGTFRTQPILFDNQGVIRWYLDLSFPNAITWPIQRLSNGNFFVGSGTHIYEIDMLGQIHRDWNLGNYHVHHDLIELPNGNLIIAVDKDGSTIDVNGMPVPSVEDHIIELDRNTGNVLTEWDLRQILDIDRYDVIDGSNGDWFHMNAVWYDASDNTLIVSGRNQGVVKISWDNQLKWILAPHQGWGPAGPDGTGYATSDFLLTATDGTGTAYANDTQLGIQDESDFSWVWGQHTPMLLPNGNLFVLDNGFARNFDPQPNFSRAVEYAIDETNMTVQQVWQYGKERGVSCWSPIISDVDYLPQTGNRLFLPGTINDNGEHYAKFIEVDANREVVFEATIVFQDLNGNGELAWGQIDIVYRSERLPLYPN